MDDERDFAASRLAPFGKRSEVIQGFFHDAVRRFEDGSLDFVYIDGFAKSGSEEAKTFDQWWPKLKPGGTFAGHDYAGSFPKVKKFVDGYMKGKNLEFWITKEPIKEKSWFTLKPLSP